MKYSREPKTLVLHRLRDLITPLSVGVMSRNLGRTNYFGHPRSKPFSIRRERTQKVVKDVSEATVLTDEDASVLEIVLGILLVNSFEISIYDREQEIRSSTDSSIQGLFALASMPSHSCVANATHDFSTRETGYRMIMRAVVRDGFRAQPPAEFNRVSNLKLGMKFRNNID